MKFQSVLLTAALGLTMSALTVYAGPPTRIMAPQIITVPGSYFRANDTAGTSGIAVLEICANDATLNLTRRYAVAPMVKNTRSSGLEVLNGHTINANQGEGIIIDAGDINNNLLETAR